MQGYATSIEKQDIWLEFVAHFKNKTTGDAYLTEIYEFEKLSKRPFFLTDETDVKNYFEFLQKKEASGKMNMSTLAKKLWELHSFATYAVERKAEFAVPDSFEDYFFQWLKRIRGQEKFVHSVPVEDMDRLYRAAEENYMAYTIISLLHRVGLSSTEIITLKRGDLAIYENGTFAFAEQRQDACYIPPDVNEILELYLRKVEDAQETDSGEYLFFNRYGKPLNKMYISRMLKTYTKKAGIPSYSAEKIRTTCGITMFAYGVKPGQIAKQMGITKIQIQKYQKRQYQDNLLVKANELVKINIKPPKDK